MDSTHLTIFCAVVLLYVGCQELGLIQNKPGVCYKIHTSSQPRLYPNPRKPEYKNIHESCTEWLKEKEYNNCLGLRTQNDEVIMLSCKGVTSRRRRGCYKIINQDKKEEIVCQKVNRNEGCEVLTTRSNLTIVIHCIPRGYSPSIFDIRTRKPPREYRETSD
uniref:Uncharacterized protein LOC114329166 isoform X1 n=1 Tax=Diabrotica virgifera virgifera TaxID=50390 RepID=A0A6P7FE39_DIAVI